MNSVDSTENKAHPSSPIPGVSFILLKQTNCALVWINMKMGHCHNHFCIFYTFISLCKKKGSSVSLSIIRKAQKTIILSTTNFFFMQGRVTNNMTCVEPTLTKETITTKEWCSYFSYPYDVRNGHISRNTHFSPFLVVFYLRVLIGSSDILPRIYH